MIPSHGLVSPIRTPHERPTSNNDDQFCDGRRGPTEDARIFSFSPPAARNKQSSSYCGDPSGVSPNRVAGSSNKIRSPPPVLCRIPTLQHTAPAWIKGEVPCLAVSQQRGAADPPSSEELASAIEESCNKVPLPAWKKKLLEKKNAKPDLPSWKQNLLEKRQAKDTVSEMTTENVNDPPWKQELVARKRERLAKSEPSVQRETSDAHDSHESEDPLQSDDSFFIKTEAEDGIVEDTTLENQQKSSTSLGIDPPDTTEIIHFTPIFDEEAEAVANTDDHADSNNDDDSSTCSHDRTNKGKVSSFAGHDSGLEAFLEDTTTVKTCSGTAVTASSSSSSASETSSPERSHEEIKSALETKSADKEFSEEHRFDIENIGDGLTVEKRTSQQAPEMENNNDSEYSDSDDEFDEPSGSDDDSVSEDERDNSRSAGFSNNDKRTDSATPRQHKRRKARRYALPICEDCSSDGEDDVLPPGMTPTVVPPMEFDDFSREDFSATTDEETLFLADHYNRQRSVVKKATFSDEPTKEDISLVSSETDGDKKKHKRKKKKRTKISKCHESSNNNKSSKKKKITSPGELNSHDNNKKHKKERTKSSTCSVGTEKSKKDKDSARSKSSKKDKDSAKSKSSKKDKKSKSSKKDSKHGEVKKKDSKHTKNGGKKKTKKASKEKKEKSKNVCL